jgi:hypothetical protein
MGYIILDQTNDKLLSTKRFNWEWEAKQWIAKHKPNQTGIAIIELGDVCSVTK